MNSKNIKENSGKGSWKMKKMSVAIAASALSVSMVHAQNAESSLSEEMIDTGVNVAKSNSDVEEVIVVGYSTINKKDLTGAVESVDMEEVADMSSSNLMKNLQGKIAGVQILTNGNPNSTAAVKIRGQGLGGLGFNDPLYVIDGVPTLKGMHELSSHDIESTQVLRDAASASIYGARAANGVIVITTKRNQQEEGSSFDFRLNQSYQNFDYEIMPLSAEQRAQVLFQAAINDRKNPNSASPLYSYDWNGDFDAPVLNGITLGRYDGFIDGAQTMRASNTDWHKEVIQQAKVTDFALSGTSGSQNGGVYGAFNYYANEGVVDSTKFERLSFRLNSDYSFFDDSIRVGQSAAVTEQTANLVNDLAEGVLNLGVEQQSIVPIYTEDGGWGGPTGGITDRDNPVRIIQENKFNESTYNRFLGSTFVEWAPDFVDGLTLKSLVGIDHAQYNFRRFQKASQAGSINISDALTNINWRDRSVVFTNTAQYKVTFNDNHYFDFLAGMEAIDFESESVVAESNDFALQDYDFAYASQATGISTVRGDGDAWALRSQFFKVDYNYADRYLAQFTMRRDGSSRFGANNRWGLFPSVAAAWRISEEEFFDFDAVDDLKLRISWGENGNQQIDTKAAIGIYTPRYATRSIFTNTYDEGTAYDLAGANQGILPSGYAKTQTANPDLKWETSTMTNVGVDFTLSDSRFNGSLDWYTKTTDDILTTTRPLATEGEGAQRVVNGGSIENSGVEFSMSYEDQITLVDDWGDFDIRISGNIAKSKNEVVKLPADVVNSFGGNGRDITILGESINSIYGYVTDGLFQNQDEVDAHAFQSGAAPGRIRFVDSNGDGVINSDDQRFFGTTDPDYIYGLGFDVTKGNWSFNMFWQGVEGGLARDGWANFNRFTSQNAGSNYGSLTLNAWTPQNPSSDIPALTLTDNNGEGKQSDFFWEDASYLKLRNVSVAYNFNDSPFLRDLGLSNSRIYFRAENLLTFTAKGARIQDPETPGAVFPIPTSFTLGFEASLNNF